MKTWVKPSVSELDIKLTESGSISYSQEGERVYIGEEKIFVGYSSDS